MLLSHSQPSRVNRGIIALRLVGNLKLKVKGEGVVHWAVLSRLSYLEVGEALETLMVLVEGNGVVLQVVLP